MDLKVLFLGAGRRVSLFERLKNQFLNCQSIEKVDFFSIEATKGVPISDISEIFIGPKFSDNDFSDFLLNTIYSNNIDIVIPCMDSSIGPLSYLRRQIVELNCFPLVSDYEVCQIFNSKESANQWFDNQSIRRIQDVDPLVHDFSNKFVFAKPKQGFGARGQIILKTEQNFVEHYANNSNQYLYQEYITGCDEYTVDCYVSKNGIVSIVPRIRLEVIHGEVSKTCISRNDAIIRYTENLLNKAKFFGPITVQMFDTLDEPTLVEINLRFGGGVIASFEAGCEYGNWILDDINNVAIHKYNDWKDNLLMMRANREFFYYG